MVMTAPLDGVSGVVNSDVVVDEVAHAAGPAVPNARAPNSTGTNRRAKANCLEGIQRLNATMGDSVMGFKAPIDTVSSQALSVRNERLTKKAAVHRSSPAGAPLVMDCTGLRQLLENTLRFGTLLLLLWGI
jgi:hypothetical protein